jgi:hypothetical protein
MGNGPEMVKYRLPWPSVRDFDDGVGRIVSRVKLVGERAIFSLQRHRAATDGFDIPVFSISPDRTASIANTIACEVHPLNNLRVSHAGAPISRPENLSAPAHVSAFQLKNVKSDPVPNVKVVLPYIIQQFSKFLVEFFGLFTRQYCPNIPARPYSSAPGFFGERNGDVIGVIRLQSKLAYRPFRNSKSRFLSVMMFSPRTVFVQQFPCPLRNRVRVAHPV